MTSSGIVLMPFNSVRYSIILSIGLGLFITGSVFNEVVIDNRHLSKIESIKLVVVSLTLAIGIGMISGGISHFKESPNYVALLIPLGIVISFISFTIKSNVKLSKEAFITLIVAVVAFAVVINIGLSMMASGMMVDMAPGGDIFKGGH